MPSGGLSHTSRQQGNTSTATLLTVLGIFVAVVSLVVAVLQWQRPKSPPPNKDSPSLSYVEEVESPQDAELFATYLIDHIDQRVTLKVTFYPPQLPVDIDEKAENGAATRFHLPQVKHVKDTTLTSGFECTIFGFVKGYMKNYFGFGAHGGYDLRGTYDILDGGPQTGGAWVAMQAIRVD